MMVRVTHVNTLFQDKKNDIDDHGNDGEDHDHDSDEEEDESCPCVYTLARPPLL